ncbi:extracellular solute-binding protein [Plantibacter auratus]|uniref:extracellular solute-binding protein n=1 Tax=Plantibacter auratus TaxID=272914 RepID=UPI003D3362A0
MIAVAAISAAAALALTGCGRSADTGASDGAALELDDSPAKGTVTIWAQGSEGEALKDFIKPFEKANPDVTVKVTAVPWDSAQNKYQTAVAGGTTPDIGMLGSDWMPGFQNALSPKPDAIDTSDMFDFATQSTTFDDTQYGVPWYVETRVLFYRTDLAEQAGFGTFPTDWDGFKSLAKAYQTQTGAKYGVVLPSGGWNGFLGSLPFAWSNGAEITNADQTEWTIDTPQVTGAVDYLDTFFTEGIANPNPDGEAGSTASNFVDGSVPMFISGPWDIPGLKTAGGPGFEDKFAVAQIPASTDGTSTSFAAGANLTVFKAAKNPDAAWKLIKWLSDPKVQVDWFSTVNDLPAQQSAWKDSKLTEDPKVAVFGDQLRSVKIAPTLSTWAQVSAAADTTLEQILRGGKDPAEALKDLQQQAEALGTGK